MIPNLNSIIERLSSAFRIETEIEETEDAIILHTHSYLGTKLLYSHSLDLSPLMDKIQSRIMNEIEDDVDYLTAEKHRY